MNGGIAMLNQVYTPVAELQPGIPGWLWLGILAAGAVAAYGIYATLADRAERPSRARAFRPYPDSTAEAFAKVSADLADEYHEQSLADAVRAISDAIAPPHRRVTFDTPVSVILDRPVTYDDRYGDTT